MIAKDAEAAAAAAAYLIAAIIINRFSSWLLHSHHQNPYSIHLVVPFCSLLGSLPPLCLAHSAAF
jgi:hypothetical protein